MSFFEKTRARLRPRWWVAGLAAMLALVGTDTLYHWRTTRELSWERNPAPPAYDSSSPSGYAFDQHVLILPYQGIDGLHWIMQTQEMLAGGGARIRAVDYDNAPDGREVHWASALRWWMAALATVEHFYTGTPLALAVEDIAAYASTLLVVLLLVLVIPIVARRFGSVPAALLALGAVGVGPFYESYTEGRLDHHGLASLNALLTVLLLAGGGAGWIRQGDLPKGEPSPLLAWLPDRRQARRWFIAAGIVGGIGLWISAASEIPVIAECGLGALLATGLLARGARPEDPARADPSLWRVWGWSGAATGVFFYLLEYFPSHLGLRLEVNHPLHAAAWAGGGEIIFRVCRWLGGGKLIERPFDVAWLAGSVLAVAAVPALMYFAADQVFWVNDRFLWTMHQDNIEEFFTMGAFLKSQWEGGQIFVFFLFANPVVLLVAPMVWWSGSAAFPRPVRALLLVALPPGVITFGFSIVQVRWIEINYSVWLAALVIVALALRLSGNFRWTWPKGLAAAVLLAWGLLANPAFLVKEWMLNDGKAPPSQVEVLDQMVRDAAQRLRTRVGGAQPIVLSGATSSTWLTYYGGFKTVGTYYWENLPGLKDAAAIYGTSYRYAPILFQKRGITYLVVFSFVDEPEEYARLAHGLRRADAAPADALMVHLKKTSQVPQWLRPIYYPVPDPFRHRLSISIYAWAPQQTVAEALTRLAQLQLDEGLPAPALNLLREAINQNPNYLPALTALAQIQADNNQLPELSATLQREQALALLSPPLELGDRVDLAIVASRLQDKSFLRQQLELAIREASTEKLRALRAQTLGNLLFFARITGLLAERPALWPVGLELLPKATRVQLLEQCANWEVTNGHPHEAVGWLRQALAVDPDALPALNGLALLLCTSPDPSVRNGADAVALARHADDVDPLHQAVLADTLACAYAETQDFAKAVESENEAIRRARAATPPQNDASFQAHLALFRQKLPCRE
ncbi:MAG TPA: hypothetical protein VHC95_01220 [Opitutales bacterium]|nr:hypothetical protein [Opitutales bacterium]